MTEENFYDQEFVEYILKHILDHPDDLVITRTVDELGVLITVKVHEDDMGTIIGKGGQTAKSIRTLLRVIGSKNKARVNLKILDQEKDAAEASSLSADLENIEKIGNYNGQYFVLGGLLPILEKEPERRIRIKKLLEITKEKIKGKELKEIILALSLNPEGENTLDYLSEQIKLVAKKYPLKITTLGRGLSTGTELEYLDDNTFENAFKNRN